MDKGIRWYMNLGWTENYDAHGTCDSGFDCLNEAQVVTPPISVTKFTSLYIFTFNILLFHL